MRSFYDKVIRHRKLILIFFAIITVLMLFCQSFVSVNYDMNSYLPEDSDSTVALEVMEEEFDGGIPNARVMVRDVDIPGALEYKARLSAIEGVTEVQWLDDVVSITQPLETADTDTVETYYKDGNALFTVTIREDSIIDTVAAIRELIGDDNAMTGSAVSTAIATESTVSEIRAISVVAVLFVLFLLTITTTSWVEPFVVLLGLGVAIIINAGSNLIFGEISFVTNAAGSILQLAVSLDYSVFLIHRFEECRQEEADVKLAMREALVKSTSSILSSGLTTVIGFLALVLMRFRIGPDLGLALAKGIAISLLTVFLFMPGFILATCKWMDKTKHRPLLPGFHGFGVLVSKVMLPLAVLFIGIMAPAYLSSVSNEYYYGSSHIFEEGTQLGDDTAAIEGIFGEKDTYVLLVPRGDVATEKALSDELKELEDVTGIISYVDLAGVQIPYEYLDEESLSLLESENYSRMVISVDVPYEGERTNELIDAIRECADRYYPGSYHLAGEGVSTYDLQETVTADMLKVNLLAIGAVFLVLLLSIRCLSLPIILVLTIETAIWLNLSIPYYMGSPLFYIAYLIISSIQLGATVDYAILFTDRYRENRRELGKKESIIQTVSNVTVSVLTSGLALAVVGTLLGVISTHELLSQLGFLLGRGSVCSLFAVLFILPGFLYMFDRTFIGRKGAADMKKTEKISKKKAMKKCRQATALALVGVLLTGNVQTVFAAEQPSGKEEIVYAMTDAGGNVTGVYVVNVFSGGDIVDYGNYTDVRNMTGTEAISVDGDKISFYSDADKAYYQGNLETRDIPWDIDISYYMDGKEYTPEEIAGMSGKLEIGMTIRQNRKCDESFWEGYALQATVLLDTEKCSNIVAEGATVANVASDKQLSYIILPGKGADISITADVTDFEMDAISINGVRLNIDVDTTEGELQDKVKEIQDAIVELNDGAAELNDGAGSLDDGAKELDDGVRTIQEALDTLNGKSSSLTAGSGEVLDALKKIQSSLDKVAVTSQDLTALSQASTQIKGGIDSLAGGLQTMDDSITKYYSSVSSMDLSTGLATDTQRDVYSAYAQAETNSQGSGAAAAVGRLQERTNGGNMEAQEVLADYLAAESSSNGSGAAVIQSYIANAGKYVAADELLSGLDSALDSSNQNGVRYGAIALQNSYGQFDATIQQMVTSLGSLAESMGELKSGIDKLVTNYTKLDSGIREYTDGVSRILDGYDTLCEGAADLAEGTGNLYSGTQELLDGTDAFRTETSDMETQISDTITDTIQGKDVETVSFVSDKNTNIDSVLFVIKTQAIEIQETEPEVQEKEELTFWEKFLAIFGWGKE